MLRKKILTIDKCYVCNSDKIETIIIKGFTHLACKNCQHLRLHPKHLVPSADLYPDDYFNGTMFQETKGETGYPFSCSDISQSYRSALYKNYINELRKLFAPNHPQHQKRILELGCAYGNFLKLLKEEMGDVEAHGIEINPEVCNKASSNLGGAPVYCVDLKSDNKGVVPRNYFDAAVLFDAIEHLDDPQSYLKALADCCKTKSYLLFSTPNIESLNARLYGGRWILYGPPRHTYYFGPKSVVILLEQSGWKMKYFFTERTLFHNERYGLETWRGKLSRFIFGNHFCDIITNRILKIGSVMVVMARKS